MIKQFKIVELYLDTIDIICQKYFRLSVKNYDRGGSKMDLLNPVLARLGFLVRNF